jgi:hypothetical protein
MPPPRLPAWLPEAPWIVRAFALALAAVLAGYMFMGRGFAHIAIGPIFVGDWVLLLGILATAVVVLRTGIHVRIGWTVGLLIAFMVLGAIRTVPYLDQYGLVALRDGVLWGYGFFAVFVYVLADRSWLRTAARAYGAIVPVFAVWLPISLAIFEASQVGIDPTRPGTNHPLVFFKAGDMAVHSVAAVAVLLLAPGIIGALRATIARFVVSLPLTWAVFVTGAASRGAILAAAAGLTVSALASRRAINWAPVLAAAIVMVVGLNASGLFAGTVEILPPPTATASPVVPSESPGATHRTPRPTHGTPLPTREPEPTAVPTDPPGRQFSTAQWFQNIASIFGGSSDEELDGTRAFRLAWWAAIADYTVLGPYFWTGKGFGVNLADDDGFQPTADHSLRAPHNSHMTVLARMGVPGALLWVLLQVAFFVGMIRAVRAHRRNGEPGLAALGAWALVVWAAMMVVTSFDPYLEGPQGGIWFWTVFGLGLVVMRMVPRRAAG